MTARGACLLAVFVLDGCGWPHRDLISRGVYRLETVGVTGCEVAAAAEDDAGRMRLTGLIRGFRLVHPVDGTVDIRLVPPGGGVPTSRSVRLRLVPHRRTSHSHPEFEAVFDALPPPGTLIQVHPRFPLCPAGTPERPTQ